MGATFYSYFERGKGQDLKGKVSADARLLLIVLGMNDQVIFAFSYSEASQILQPTGRNSLDKQCKRLLLKTGTEVDCTEPALVCAIVLPPTPSARCPEQHLVSPLIAPLSAGAHRDRAESAILKTFKTWLVRALDNLTRCHW